jgi:hypothetical protein
MSCFVTWGMIRPYPKALLLKEIGADIVFALVYNIFTVFVFKMYDKKSKPERLREIEIKLDRIDRIDNSNFRKP